MDTLKTVDEWRKHARNMAHEIARVIALLADGSTTEMQHQIEANGIDWRQQMLADGLSSREVDLVLSELAVAVEKHLCPLASSTRSGRTPDAR